MSGIALLLFKSMTMGNNTSKYWHDANAKEKETFFLKEDLRFENAHGKYLWRNCQKNAGHHNFIPIKKFKQTDLPLQFQNNKVFSFIKTTSDLTVRIVARFTSEQRPEWDKLHKMKGTDCAHFGSGMVIRVEKQADRKLICLCPKCKEFPGKQRFTAKVHVSTARHVVFDVSEAIKTEAELFYDDEKDRESVRLLFGSKIIQQSEDGDTCVLECITHDKDVANTLIKKLNSLQSREEKLGKISLHSPGSLSVVASHPHGASKHISIGEIEQLCANSVTTIESQMSHDFVKTYGHETIFILPLGQPCVQVRRDMVNKNGETEATGILVDVTYPDGTKETLNIWQLGEPVQNTKKWLLEQAGYHREHQNYNLVIDVSDGYSVDMVDEKIINDYLDDLTKAVRIRFRRRNGAGSTSPKNDPSTGTGALLFNVKLVGTCS